MVKGGDDIVGAAGGTLDGAAGAQQAVEAQAGAGAAEVAAVPGLSAVTLITAAPRPWDWIWAGTGENTGHVYLVDANGRKIGTIWGRSGEKTATADLIISLVNDHADEKLLARGGK